MDVEPVPRSARDWLRRELARWRAEGLVDERAAGELTRRYRLEEEGGVSGVLFAIYVIGSVLIGGGVLSLVAWNWDRMPDVAKLALGGTGLVLAYAIGFWCWKIDGRHPHLGVALTFVGSLLFGANIGIVSQVYQLGGEWWAGVGLWGAGVALCAWTMGSAIHGVLACVLGYFWSVGYLQHLDAPWPPYVPLVVFVPLAFRVRAPILFACAAVGAVFTLGFAAAETAGQEISPFVLSVLATSALLAAAPFALGMRSDRKLGFEPVAVALGTLGVVGLAYPLSFHDAAAELSLGDVEGGRWLVAVLPQVVGALALCLWMALSRPETFRSYRPSLVVLGAGLLLFLGMLFPDPEVPLAILANLALVLVGGYAIATSMKSLDRRAYWFGSVLVGLVIVSRFIEYETGLLVKGLVFTACGVLVLVAGLSFERRIKVAGGRRA